MTKFKVTSEEGANRYGVEVGETFDRKIDEGELAAVIAAGWIEHVAPAKPKEKE